MARLGSVAAAPFAGDQFASLYLGATRVPTVPGKPVITSAIVESGGASSSVQFNFPANNGGSSITTQYRAYINGVLTTPSGGSIAQRVLVFSGDLTGQQISVTVTNAIGQGPLSDPATFA
jgi:hypothetical protein